MKSLLHTVSIIGLMAIVWPQEKIHACGIPLAEPNSFFEGVDYQGHVHLIFRLADMQIPDTTVPIFLIFNSSNRKSFPYSGTFDIPILTARMEQINDNTFLLRSPTGWVLPFVRNNENPTILDGSNGMKALIDDAKNLITAWADCGDKLVFSKGKLIEWKIKETKLSFIYAGNLVSEIQAGGKTLVRVNFDPKTNDVAGFSVGYNRDIVFKWGDQPIVQEINGTPVVASIQRTLAEVALADGSVKKFEFSIDSKKFPTITIDQSRMISWDPKSLNVISDGEWTYEIGMAKSAFLNAEISRSNKSGTEYWFYDSITSTETKKRFGGLTTIRKWHSSGILEGKTKSELRIEGAMRLEKVYSYSETGETIRLLTKLNDSVVSRRIWGADGTSIEKLQNNEGGSTIFYDSKDSIRGLFSEPTKNKSIENEY